MNYIVIIFLFCYSLSLSASQSEGLSFEQRHQAIKKRKVQQKIEAFKEKYNLKHLSPTILNKIDDVAKKGELGVVKKRRNALLKPQDVQSHDGRKTKKNNKNPEKAVQKVKVNIPTVRSFSSQSEDELKQIFRDYEGTGEVYSSVINEGQINPKSRSLFRIISHRYRSSGMRRLGLE